MAGLDINTRLFPYRISLREKKPQELVIELKNISNEPKMVSFEASLPFELAFDKGGLNRSMEKRIQELKPNEPKRFQFDVYAARMSGEGAYIGKLVVSEHYRDFDYVTKAYERELHFRITP